MSVGVGLADREKEALNSLVPLHTIVRGNGHQGSFFEAFMELVKLRLDEIVENLDRLRWRVVHLPLRRRCVQFQVFQLRCEVCQGKGDAEFGMLGEMLAEPRVRRRQQIRVVDVETDDDHASQLKRFFFQVLFRRILLDFLVKLGNIPLHLVQLRNDVGGGDVVSGDDGASGVHGCGFTMDSGRKRCRKQVCFFMTSGIVANELIVVVVIVSRFCRECE